MRWLGRQTRRLGILLALVLVWHGLTMARTDPELAVPRGQGIPVWVVDHGYHSGLIVEAATLRRAAVEVGRSDVAAGMRLRWLASRFPDAEWVEVGWGDAAFYQQTPGIGDVDAVLGLRALVIPTKAVLQVVPGWGPAGLGFPASDTLRLDLSDAGLSALALRLAQTIPDPVPAAGLGPSLYGFGAFFPAELDYHLFRTCNHWVAWLLRGAGVPASPLPGTFSATLMAELRLRAMAAPRGS